MPITKETKPQKEGDPVCSVSAPDDRRLQRKIGKSGMRRIDNSMRGDAGDGGKQRRGYLR